MKVISLGDGVKVRCWGINRGGCNFSTKPKYHVIKGYQGNNQGWTDKSGWGGSYDVAHGYFESTQAWSLCPKCKQLQDIKDIVIMKEIEDMARKEAK